MATVTTVASCAVGGITFSLVERDGVYFVSCREGIRQADAAFIRNALRDTLSVAVMRMIMDDAFNQKNNNVLSAAEFADGVHPGLSLRDELTSQRDRLRALRFNCGSPMLEARESDRISTVAILNNMLNDGVSTS